MARIHLDEHGVPGVRPRVRPRIRLLRGRDGPELRPRRADPHHVGAFADKKRVLQQFAQPLKCVAHGRLRELELAAGARKIAFAVDGLQHNKQVKIDLAQMHGTNFTLFQ